MRFRMSIGMVVAALIGGVIGQMGGAEAASHPSGIRGLGEARASLTDRAWSGRVFDVAQGRWLSVEERRQRLQGLEVLVLGEKHDTPIVQLEQARALAEAWEANRDEKKQWILGWEFLNRRDQRVIDGHWSNYRRGLTSDAEFMDRLLGQGRNRSYLPILQVGVQIGAELRGVNLSREEKAPVVRGGISALDPALLPPGFALGGVGYRERFEAVMTGGHASPEQVGRYFEAQSLTDAVMADALMQGAAAFRVLVTGSFHSDYFDGVFARLLAQSSGVHRLLSIRFVDASDYPKSELEPELRLAEPVHHSTYGALADWIWFAGEPSEN